MGTTRRGLTVGTDDPGIVAALDDFTDRLAGIRPGVDAILVTVEQHSCPIGRAVVEACVAHGRGDLVTAATLLDPVITAMPAIGGSDAQDDLFRLAHPTALAGAGRTHDARSWWATMTASKSLAPLDEALRDRLG